MTHHHTANTAPDSASIQALMDLRIAEEEAYISNASHRIGETEQRHLRRPLKINPEEYVATRYLSQTPPNYDWLLKDSLRRACLGAIVGPPGAGKGTFAIQLAVAVASGTPCLGIWDIAKPGRTLYLSAEDDEAVIHRRIHHALRLLPANIQEHTARQILGIPVHGSVSLCRGDSKSGITPTDNLTDLRTLLTGFTPSLVVLDTLARFSGAEENDNKAMTSFCEFLEELCLEFGCNIILLHHSNKTAGDCVDNKIALPQALNQSAIRGASALAGCIRWGLVMVPLGKKLAGELLPDAKGRAEGSFLACRVVKKNTGAPEPSHYLGRGEQGLLFRVESLSPSQAEGDAIADAYKLAAEIKRREDSNGAPLSASRCGQDAFSWGVTRTKKAVERGLDLGLFSTTQNGKYTHLCSICSDCSTEPGTQGLLNEIS